MELRAVSDMSNERPEIHIDGFAFFVICFGISMILLSCALLIFIWKTITC